MANGHPFHGTSPFSSFTSSRPMPYLHRSLFLSIPLTGATSSLSISLTGATPQGKLPLWLSSLMLHHTRNHAQAPPFSAFARYPEPPTRAHSPLFGFSSSPAPTTSRPRLQGGKARSKGLITERCTTICWKKNQGMNFSCKSQGKSSPLLTAVSSPLFTDNQARLSLRVPTSRRCNSKIRGQAYIYHSSGFRIPSNAEKPEWWWRTLSCIPYLIAMQMSATGFYLEPFLEKFQFFENLIFYIPGGVNRLPSWFPMIYCYLAIVGVVKNKDLPLVFRYHVMMGMLLEISLQVLWVSSNFMPLVHFNGTLGIYYWAGVALAYILIMLECIRCALLGTFVKVPFVSESAFLHSLFNLGGFQRPF